jgi:membrane protein implicated in regulation of membrane protease activity
MIAKPVLFWMIMAAAVVGLWWGIQQEPWNRTLWVVGAVAFVLVAQVLLRRFLAKRGSHKDPA